MSMFSYVFSSASTYFTYLPDDDYEEDQVYLHKHSRRSSYAGPSTSDHITSPVDPKAAGEQSGIIGDILAENDLYRILGIQRTSDIDKLVLRRAYLKRSKACHPDKFPDNPSATRAFQKVSVAYDVLSRPSSKRAYDARPPSSSEFDFFATRPYTHPDQTFRAVVVSVFNDFLDGDLDMVRSLLKSVSDLNPALRLTEDSIDAVLDSLNAVRKRALTCRVLALALHSELLRLLEIQHALRQLGYFEIRRRARLALELARLTLTLPIALESALVDAKRREMLKDGVASAQDHDRKAIEQAVLVPRRVNTLICAMAVVLERMEGVLGGG